MIKLIKPTMEHENNYKEMIREWQEYGGPYVPCIIEYDCSNPVQELDYSAVLKVVEDYGKGNIFDYDLNHFESSDFYFLFDDEDLIGMGEVRHHLKPLGVATVGHISCGIRPSKRRKGYASESILWMIEKLKEDGVTEVILCHDSKNDIASRFIEKLNFQFQDSVVSLDHQKEIKCYTKRLGDFYE